MADRPRTFHLQRYTDGTGISGVGRVADGVLWTDGTVTIHWLGGHASYVHWPRGALDARRNRNTGPQQSQRAPRRIDPRRSR